ncbi:hypothetical protein JTE90_016775 [Oedothorax gibbosus]|uniref:Uncharacterized protein n=1 Tax=Oedothorax gibbosus TaxID=931172 RepID=A0AAV6VZ31_9ARAC|nr:hypothetical protein JTE90_016775 [Oedothorax gibbosus]
MKLARPIPLIHDAEYMGLLNVNSVMVKGSAVRYRYTCWFTARASSLDRISSSRCPSLSATCGAPSHLVRCSKDAFHLSQLNVVECDFSSDVYLPIFGKILSIVLRPSDVASPPSLVPHLDASGRRCVSIFSPKSRLIGLIAPIPVRGLSFSR